MKICNVCGKALADNAKFCSKCGANVMDIEPLREEAPQPEPPQPAPPQPAPQRPEPPQPETRRMEAPPAEEPRMAAAHEEDVYAEPQFQEPQFQEPEIQEPQFREPEFQEPQFREPPREEAYARREPEYDAYEQRARARYRVPEWDHTLEFEPEDAADHKILAMIAYLLGPIGIIIGMIGGKDSPYAKFHIRQGIKIQILYGVVTIVGTVVGMILSGAAMIELRAIANNIANYTVYSMPSFVSFKILIGLCVVIGICYVILMIIQLIAFFGTCKGDAKEPPLVRSFNFMR